MGTVNARVGRFKTFAVSCAYTVTCETWFRPTVAMLGSTIRALLVPVVSTSTYGF